MKTFFPVTVLVMLLSLVACGQTADSCESFRKLVKDVYDFKPSLLSEAEQTKRSEAMDRVWSNAKSNPKLLPCLWSLLRAPDANPFFLFDGSNLLMTLDQSQDAKAFQVGTYSQVDLDDVDLRVWVRTLARRGIEGFDVSGAGSRWLSYPKASYFLPEHGAYQVKRFEGALFIFGSMDEAQATPALLKVAAEQNHPGKEIAMQILMNLATPESLRALKQLDVKGLSADTRSSLESLLTTPQLLTPRPKPKSTRAEFLKAFQRILEGDSADFDSLVEKVPDGEHDVVAVLRPEDLPLVRRVRRRIIANANQHAIEYYNSFTSILMALVWKPELVH